MGNLYYKFTTFFYKIFFGAAFFLFSLQGFGQAQVNINKTGSKPDVEVNLSEKANIPFFAEAKRARVFDLNSNIANPRGLQQGQKIRLQLFRDKDFSSTIIRKSTDVNGVTAVTLKLNDYEYAYGYITVSENSFLITIDIPETQEKFTTRKNPENNSHYLLQLDKDKWDIMDEGEPVNLNETDDGNNYPLPDNNRMDSAPTEGGDLQSLEDTSLSPDDDATVNIMIVYTPAARDWANTYNESIDNTVATAMASANNVSANSGLGINYNLIYSGLVDHLEEGAGNDLSALRNEDDDRMDEIHDIRRDVQADLVAIFTLTEDTGGLAYLLFDKYGKPDLGFSLTRVQQATDSYTFIHELGHNMGLGHYKYQNVQPGNTNWVNWPENTWSGGWRWKSTDSNMYSDVMTYEGGQYHEDGITSYRTPYFSDPDHIYIGAKAGDEVEGNGSRTLREMKHVISQYSERIKYCKAVSEKIEMLYIERVALGKIDQSSSTTRYSDYSYLSTNFRPQEKQIMTVDVGGFGKEKQVLVWIDWNDDSVFDPLTELVFSSNKNADSYQIDITPPLGNDPGSKRMRIRLHDEATGGNATSCGSSTYGEVEDYTLMLDDVAPCELASVPGNLKVSEHTESGFQLSWDPLPGISSYDIKYRKTGDEDWNKISNVLYPFHTMENLEASTDYEVQVQSVCSSTQSDYSPSVLVTTGTAASSISFLIHPTDTQSGRTIDTIKVELLDVEGIRSSSTAEVSLSLIMNQATGAVLSGRSTVAASDGIAVFTDLKIDMEGTFAIQAKSEALPVIESDNFTIQPYIQANLIVSNTANDGPGSLREAIEHANETEVSDLITFDIAGNGPHIITLLENLPPITQQVILDATTQPGYTLGKPVIVLDGNNVPLIPNDSPDLPTGLFLTGNSSGSTIKGFIIGGFGHGEETEEQAEPFSTGTGIRSIVTNTVIQGNWIGLSPDGVSPNKNVWGIYLSEGNNLVGGINSEERNVISGNWRYGIHMDMNSNNNRVEGNYIGTSADGSQRLWNRYGIYAYTSENQIIKNTISGNVTGLILSGNLNVISNNQIGTNPSGDSAVSNNDGIWVLTSGQKIGIIDQGNLISGNKNYGIHFRNGAANNHLIANQIGTDITGSSSIPNMTGVYLDGSYTINNTIGGTNPGEGNVISGNSNYGIQDTGGANHNWIYGNFIGTGKAENKAVPNGNGGIALEGSGGNVVGGVEPGQRNVIAYNNGWGISVNGWSGGNNISANQIFSNSIIGIDLGADGITGNDRDDGDYGPNRLQNYPELKNSADLEGGYLNLEYTVGSTSQYSTFPITVEFFKSDGNRQGKEYLGFDVFSESDITKGKKGKVIRLQLVPGTTLNGGDKILATATDAEGNTSEFGAEVDVTGGCAETVYYADADGDGFGDPLNSQSSCTQPEGYVTNSDDCDDTDAEIQSGPTWYADTDGDGYGNPDNTQTSCDQPEGYVSNSDDCDDTDDLINTDTIWYADADGDGFGDPDTTKTGCDQPEGYVINNEDCDDTDAETVEGSVWYADTDADGLGDPDSTETSCDQPVGFVENNHDCDDTDANIRSGPTWYADKDGDGYGDPSVSNTACDQPEGFVANSDDCDDTDALINPDTIWYADTDGDGLGDTNNTKTGCDQPEGFVTNDSDCDDTNAEVGEGIAWYADADGDGLGDPEITETACDPPAGYVENNEDCDDTNAEVGAQSTWYADSDNDGFGDPNDMQTSCDQPISYVANSDDCDDTDATVNPDATDVCKDCDATTDTEDCEAPVECLGTDVLTLSEVCTDASNVHWVINNPDSCEVLVQWESRKTNESNTFQVPNGDTFFSTKISNRGPTQVTIYWPDSNGKETKTSTNASGISCTSSTEITSSSVEDTSESPEPGLSVNPNPITAEGIWLHFTLRENKANFNVTVYDLSGRRLAQKKFEADTAGSSHLWEINQSRWIPGIYILNAESGEEIYQIKIIK